MKTKKVVVTLSALSILMVIVSLLVLEGSTKSKAAERDSDSGTMRLGKVVGRVVHDPEKGYYFLELIGARFSFRTDPIEALEVLLQAPGKDKLAKNTALLYGMLGQEVLHTTILINPDEEDEVMPAATDLAQYLQIINPTKFAGIAYTKPGGKLKRSVVKGSQIQSLKGATPQTPIIQIKGPKSRAKVTVVKVLGKGKFIIQGKTYEDTYRAADFVCITLLKMLYGSPDCPDAAACTTGEDCGCG